jgi:hypothetical protein
MSLRLCLQDSLNSYSLEVLHPVHIYGLYKRVIFIHVAQNLFVVVDMLVANLSSILLLLFEDYLNIQSLIMNQILQ